MRNDARCLLILLPLLVILMQCKKEYSKENGSRAHGTLKSALTGDCLPETLSGEYMQNVALNDSNVLEVTVDVRSVGFYSISSDTVNGYSFSSSGTFSNTGLSKVTLQGKGRPVSPKNDFFTIRFDSSVCKTTVTVNPDFSKVPANFTLSGTPNNCMNDSLTGDYVKGRPLTDSAYVLIEVNVTTPGTYMVSTPVVNGYSFSGTGLMTKAGIQKIRLTAKGTPLTEGTNIFNVVAGTANCSFNVTVQLPVVVTGTDYFPLTFRSSWNYDDLYNIGFTFNRKITDSTRIAAVEFKTMTETPAQGVTSTFNFRKTDTAYYENCAVDRYTTSFKFAPVISGQLPFLRTNLMTGQTWYSEEYIGPAVGVPILYFRYEYSCLDADGIATLSGKTFVNVYKVSIRPQLRSATTYPFNYTSEQTINYYAKGIGLIYTRTIVNNFVFQERQIHDWLVF